jgi:lysophospholipase L1-like esterase
MLDDGHAVDMMGTRRKVNGTRPDHRGKAFDADHEGYWGISAEWLYKKPIAKQLEEIKASNGGRLVDFTLYHIGTNDINTKDRAHGEKYVTATVVPHIEKTIDALRAHNPDITILLCKIIPIKNNQAVRMSLVDYLNGQHIDAIRKRKDTPRSRVIVVDQHAGFDATRGADTYDGMHPNDRGGEKMAAKFYVAIKAHWASKERAFFPPDRHVIPHQ